MLASAHSWYDSWLPELCVENLWAWFNMQVLTVFIRRCLSLPAPETDVFRVVDGQWAGLSFDEIFKNADSKFKKKIKKEEKALIATFGRKKP